MRGIYHNHFLEAARFVSTSEPHDVVTQLRRGARVWEYEAVRLLEWVVHETQEMLAKALAKEGLDIKHNALHGWCAFSQCVTAYALIDRGLTPAPFSSQSLPGHQVTHAMLMLHLSTEQGETLYLIDPTYRQFYDPEKPRLPNGNLSPGFLLEQEEGGSLIVYSLIRDGYLKMTPEIAHRYIASLCNGVAPFETPEESFSWLHAPPFENGYDFMSREAMQQRSMLIYSSQIV